MIYSNFQPTHDVTHTIICPNCAGAGYYMVVGDNRHRTCWLCKGLKRIKLKAMAVGDLNLNPEELAILEALNKALADYGRLDILDATDLIHFEEFLHGAKKVILARPTIRALETREEKKVTVQE